MRVLITGAQGFLGRYLVADWLKNDTRVNILGIGRSAPHERTFTHLVHRVKQEIPAPLPQGLIDALTPGRYEYISLDMLDKYGLVQVLEESRPHIIVHLAASLRDDPPTQLVRANMGTVAALFECLADAQIDSPRVVFASSGSVYGRAPNRTVPLREDAPCAPIEPYSVTKLAAEELSRILGRLGGVSMIRARIFNPVGPGQDERHLCGYVASQLAAIKWGLQPAVLSIGSIDTTRDFIDVRDTATALRIIALKGISGRIYNVASGVETSGRQILDTFLRLVDLVGLIKVERRQARAVDIERHFADINELLNLGYRSCFDLEESLSDVLRYYFESVLPAAVLSAPKERIGVKT